MLSWQDEIAQVSRTAFGDYIILQKDGQVYLGLGNEGRLIKVKSEDEALRIASENYNERAAKADARHKRAACECSCHRDPLTEPELEDGHCVGCACEWTEGQQGARRVERLRAWRCGRSMTASIPDPQV